MHYGLNKPGMSIGVVGLGGLGAHAVRIAKAMGLRVTAISTSPGKEAEVREKLGADDFILSSSPDALAAAAKTLDGVIDTVSAAHDFSPLLDLLKTGGKLVLLGAPPAAPKLPVFPLLFRRLTVGI
jgi:D-arabinose 1-dehydrogenase-like Zn-dependent alcohol dehydrogenase